MSVGGVGGASGHFRTEAKESGFGSAAGGIFKSLLIGGASAATAGAGGIGGSIMSKLLGGSDSSSGVDGGELSQSEMLKRQDKILQESRFWQFETNVMKAKHDMNKSILQNIRA